MNVTRKDEEKNVINNLYSSHLVGFILIRSSFFCSISQSRFFENSELKTNSNEIKCRLCAKIVSLTSLEPLSAVNFDGGRFTESPAKALERIFRNGDFCKNIENEFSERLNVVHQFTVLVSILICLLNSEVTASLEITGELNCSLFSFERFNEAVSS